MLLRLKARQVLNTKVFIEEMNAQDINHVGRLTIQMLAYKRDKNFILKEPVNVELRLEPLKFYKVHTFEDTPFFETPVLLYTIIENDKPVRPLVVDAKTLKKEMYAHSEPAKNEAISKEKKDQLVRRYEDNQSKGNAKNSPYIHHRGARRCACRGPACRSAA